MRGTRTPCACSDADLTPLFEVSKRHVGSYLAVLCLLIHLQTLPQEKQAQNDIEKMRAGRNAGRTTFGQLKKCRIRRLFVRIERPANDLCLCKVFPYPMKRPCACWPSHKLRGLPFCKLTSNERESDYLTYLNAEPVLINHAQTICDLHMP